MDRYVDLTVKYNKENIHFSWNIYAHITAYFIVALGYFKYVWVFSPIYVFATITGVCISYV